MKNSSLSRRASYNLWSFYAVSYLTMLSLLILYSLLISHTTYDNMRAEAENRNLLVMNNVCNTLDQKLNELHSVAATIGANNSVAAFSKSPGPSAYTAGQARLLWDEIHMSYLQEHDMVSSIALYFPSTGVVMSRNDIYLSLNTYIQCLQDHSTGLESCFDGSTARFVAPSFLAKDGTELIPYFCRLPSSNLNDQAKAVFMLEKRRVDELFAPLTLDDGCVFIADRKGQLFYVNGAAPELADPSLLTEQAVSRRSIGNIPMIVYHVSSRENGWQLISVLPESSVFKRTNYIKTYTMLLLAAMVVIGLTLTAIFSRRYARPWTRLEHIFSSGENTGLPAPISDAISPIIAEKANERSRIQQTMAQQRSILERTTVTHLLSGGYVEPRSNDWLIPENIEKAQTHQVILARAVDVDSAVQGSWRLVNALRPFDQYYCVQMSAMDAAIIIVSPSESPEACAQQTEALLSLISEQICRELELSLQLFVSGVHTRTEDLARSYEEAGRAAASAATDTSGIYYYQPEDEAPCMYAFSLETERKLLQFAINGHRDGCIALLDDIYASNFTQSWMHTWMRRQFISELTGTWLKIKQYLDGEFQPASLPFDPESAPEQFFADYREAILSCCDESAERRANRANNLCQRIDSYLQSHYNDPSLSLSMIADAFGMSESTFSRQFKALTGSTFAAHLESLRIEKAVAEMVATAEPIGSIANAVGYNSFQTFGRAFKRHYGQSPDAWRKDHGSSSSD